MASPTHLRAAADALRRTATAIEADFSGLADTGGAETWIGPAATQYRWAAHRSEDRAGDVGAALLALAARLDTEAAGVERRLAHEEAAARTRQSLVARSRAGLAPDHPLCFALPGPACTVPAPPRTRGRG